MDFPYLKSVTQTYYDNTAAITENESLTVAKIIHYDGVDKYYVRENRDGLLNVHNITEDYDKKIRGMDKDLYPFSQITKEAFDLYLEYLTTKSNNLLRNAERVRRINV